MTRIPDAVSVASLDTHRLIVAVPNHGPAEVSCNLPRPVAASVLRQLADSLDSPAGQCETALITGRPCPVHDAPVSPSQAQRPAGLDALLGYVAASMADEEQAAEEPPALTVDDVRDALDFNAAEHDQVLATLRDVLLDTTATRTPEQALAVARVLLIAHARQLAALVEVEHNDTRSRWGLNRSTRGLLTGYSNARRSIRTYADRLADEQALAEGAANEQVEP
ncbi:hypothetical protein [Streptomyces caniscabiei]|uniref:hypothetical protein n=1 Tax=Streptomyces caniscabiei TaxID=2746961 RepID=UPI0029B95E5A|nr:hypothetical protein [Streptomyces caniscabiei]MDX2986333.1 hypothetical protein [Streptomyces caniscabiei]